MSEEKGYVYILTNPSFPDYVKIGYADDVEERVCVLNSRDCTPFAFRIYATMEVDSRLKDKAVHRIIDRLAPDKRSIDNIDGKIRVREFYAMEPEFAFDLLCEIADVFGFRDRVKKWNKTKEEKADEKTAATISKLAKNRHHFKPIEFSCSLTGHKYAGRANEEGTLEIVDLDTDEVVPNNANPSKKSILGQALMDLGEKISPNDTTYQRYHRLQKKLAK